MKKIISTLLAVILLASVMVMPAHAAVSSATIERAVQWAIDTANDDSHGYSQANRWGNPDYDCASFVISAFRSAGFELRNAVHCGNMKQPFIDEGFEWIPRSEIDLSTSKYLKRGDILLNTRSHTEIYIGDDMQVGAHDGTYDIFDYNDPGDSTGKEICPVKYNNWSNWEGILRYPAEDPIDIGDTFYATIVNNSTGKALTNDSNENCENRNVTIRSLTGEKNQLWKFEKRENGSYKISSVFNDLALDVTKAGTVAGTNVSVYFSNDKPAQQWNVYGEEGMYRLKPLCNQLALDVAPGDADGTNVRMGTDNNAASQYFSINKLSAPQSTYVECAPGTSFTQTALWWNMTLYTDAYDVEIYATAVSADEPYLTLADLKETYCQVELPAGDFKAVVYSKNVVGETKSINEVSFTVERGTGYRVGDVDLDGDISVLDATQIQLYLAQFEELTFGQIELADTDKDNDVSILDATQIQLFIARLIDSL